MQKFQLENLTLDDKSFFQAYVLIREDWNGFVLPYFSYSEALRLCFDLNNKIKNQWFVKNVTDGIVASHNLTKSDAEAFANSLRKRFVQQGFYLTSKGEKINPDLVQFEIVQIEPQAPESFYNKESDLFVIYEMIDGQEYEPVEYPGEDIVVDGMLIHVYPIGSGSWIWSVTTRFN